MAGNDSQLPPIITSSADPEIKATGWFMVGSSAAFFFTFTDIGGHVYDPSDITGVILDSSGTTVREITTFDKLDMGVFTYVWGISSSATPGTYTITITYIDETTNGQVTKTFSENFVVTEKGQPTYSYRRVATRAFLESLIGYTQRIPVFNEIARFNKNRTLAHLTFPRWNQTAGARVYANNAIKESGFTIDYLTGKLTFAQPVPTYDEIMVDYNFRWFTDKELDDFLEQGVNVVNIWAPQSVYTLDNIPDRWLIAAEYGAAIHTIRRLMMDLLYVEPTKVFNGPERTKEVFSQLETLKKNYEDQLNLMLIEKKKGPYSGLTRTITVPEFTLPGGKSRWFRMLFSTG